MRRGIVTFVFDDGYEKVYQNVLPLLRAHHFPGVFAVPLEGASLEKTEQRKIRPWRDWLSLVSEGHELASHSVTHTQLTKLTDEQLARELAEPAAAMGAVTLVYPGGAFDDRVVSAASGYYKVARTVIRGFETIPPRDLMRLHSFNWSRRNWRVWKANLLVLWAWLTNSWLIETYHMVDNDELEKRHTVATVEFARHLAFTARLPIAVQTIRDVVK